MCYMYLRYNQGFPDKVGIPDTGYIFSSRVQESHHFQIITSGYEGPAFVLYTTMMDNNKPFWTASKDHN